MEEDLKDFKTKNNENIKQFNLIDEDNEYLIKVNTQDNKLLSISCKNISKNLKYCYINNYSLEDLKNMNKL